MVDWLSNMTRKRIIIDPYPTLRARNRCSSEEILYEYLMERRFKRIEKKIRDDVYRFELYYDNPDKSIKEDNTCRLCRRIIKVVTVIIN